MKPSYLYGALAMLMLVVGMFMSTASVGANVFVLGSVFALTALSLFYLIRDHPVSDVVPGATEWAGAEIHSPLQRKAEWQRVKDLSRRMRDEPDPEVYALMAAERATLAKRIGI
jgi:sugar phosphate permease